MKDYLFIGGTRAYEIIAVRDGCNEYIMPSDLTPETISDLNKNAPDDDQMLDVEVYRKRKFDGFEIFLLWNKGIHYFSKRDIDAIALFHKAAL